MNLIKKLFKALLIYGVVVNFLFGFTTIAAENMTEIANYWESKGNGNKSAKLSFNATGTWKRIFKNLTEIKNQIVRYWRAW